MTLSATSGQIESSPAVPGGIVLLLLAWGAGVWLIGPAGDFPLNDDWAYGLPVKSLVEDGQIRFTGWQYMTLIFQVLWGAAFAGVFDFSFTALRFSTIAMGGLGIAATYALCRELRLSQATALLVAATVAFNPVYLALSCTFMTDVHFTALGVAAVWLFVRGTGRNEDATLWLAWLVLLAATMVRQVGLGIGFAALAAYGLERGLAKRWWLNAVLPFGLLVTLVVLYPRVIEATIGLPAGFHIPGSSLKGWLAGLAAGKLGALKPTLRIAGFTLLYSALLLLPVLLAFAWAHRKEALAGIRLRWWLLAGAAAGLGLSVAGVLMPLAPGILAPQGVGPMALAGDLASPPRAVLAALTILAAGFAGCLVFALIKTVGAALAARRNGESAWIVVLLLLAATLYQAPFFMVYGPWFDRYLLLFVPLAGALFLCLAPPVAYGSRVLLAAGAMVCVYAVFGVVGTHDYLEWNRQRWALAAHAERELPPGGQIDGGFEFNNYRFHAAGIKTGHRGSVRNDQARYELRFEPAPGQKVIFEQRCNVWLPVSPRRIVLVERQPARS